jgi:protein translocase SEC61 complex gamma subunit
MSQNQNKTSLSMKVRLQHFLKEYYRVLILTKKPNLVEFQTIVKVSGLGIAVIGVTGFLIFLIIYFIKHMS